MTLYAGPWQGEFGFEIACWQANVRRAARNHKKVIVGCVPSSRALYADFATDFFDVPVDHNTTSDKRYDQAAAEKITAAFGSKIRGGRWMQAKVMNPQAGDFIRYGKSHPGAAYDVVVHARDMVKGSKGGDRRRCAPREFWEALGHGLKARGLEVACVGLKECSLLIPHARNLRDADLRVMMDVIASSKVIIGPSSGPIHLAALCGCPQVVWTDTKHRGAGGRTNVERLRRAWNPFGTAVKIIHTDQKEVDGFSWIPEFEEVLAEIEEMINAQAQNPAAAYDQSDPVGTG